MGKNRDAESAGKVKLDQDEKTDKLENKTSPENTESPEDRKARESSEALDKSSKGLYANAKIENMPGGTTYSREAEKLSGVGQESAEASLLEMKSDQNWTTATPETRQDIEQKYQKLELDFMKKLDGIKGKYAAQPNQEAYAKELFDAQKQFQKDLGEVAADANGKLNGVPASKDAADAQEKARREKLAKKEQQRFEANMKDMVDMEAILLNNKRQSEQLLGAKKAEDTIDTYFAHADKKSEKPTEQIAAR